MHRRSTNEKHSESHSPPPTQIKTDQRPQKGTSNTPHVKTKGAADLKQGQGKRRHTEEEEAQRKAKMMKKGAKSNHLDNWMRTGASRGGEDRTNHYCLWYWPQLQRSVIGCGHYELPLSIAPTRWTACKQKLPSAVAHTQQ